MKRIAVFASGNGSNAQRLAEYFSNSPLARVEVIYCNNPHAYVIERAHNLQLPVVVFSRQQFAPADNQSSQSAVLTDLLNRRIDLIVLAGFLWLMPSDILQAFPRRIINIHPALLPLYGGKGMYGSKVHESVIVNKDRESGITVHLVNEEYDRGCILFQAKCPLTDADTPDTLAQKVHALEYEHFPKVVENYIQSLN